MLACTSDKGNLHIFDVPVGQRRPSPSSPPQSPGGGGQVPNPATSMVPPGTSPGEARSNKWGFLSSIPFGPFGDVYSFASAPFDAGQEPLTGQGGAGASGRAGGGNSNSTGGGGARAGGGAGGGPADYNAVLGTTSRPMKGITGWLDEQTLVVVGAGVDARWEKFALVDATDGSGGLALVREGWKRYQGST